MGEKVRTQKHWIVLICLTLIFSAHAGIINNTIGVFYSPVSESLGILRGSFAFHVTLKQLTTGVISLTIPRLISKFGWKKIIIVGTIFGVVGTAGMAFTEQLIVFYILGVIRGIGSGLFGLVPLIIVINNWFYEKNGLAISVATAFSGLIGMVFAPIYASIIESLGWQAGFIAMGITIVLFALPAIIYPYHINPKQDKLLPYGYKKESDEEDKGRAKQAKQKDNMKVISISFFALTMFSIIFTSIIGINQHLSSYGETLGMTLKTSGYMLSAVMFGNFVSKLVVGYASDHIGAVKSTVMINIINVTGLIIFIMSKGVGMSIFAAFLFGSIFSVRSVALPLLSNQFFGRRLSARVYPKLAFIGSIGIALSNTFVGFVYDFTGGYESIFLIALVLQGINFFMLYIAHKYSIKEQI